MADETPAAQTDEAPAPTPADMPQRQPQEPETSPKDDDAGRIERLNADVAKEREKRHALEGQFGAFKDAFTKALGLDQDEQLTPEQLATQVTEQTGRADSAERQLAVFRALPANVDGDALLDSSAFQKAIDKVEPDKVAETVTAFVSDHPRFLRTNPGAGASDAGAGNPPSPAKSMDDLIRGL